MATSRKRKGPEPHAHGCRRCHTRYEDCCEDRDTNALCMTCRGGLASQLLIDNRAPKDCCRIYSRLPNKDEKTKYRLGGNSLWFICDQCKRTHPYDDPKRNQS